MTRTPDSRTALGRRTLAAERAASTAVDVATRELDRRLDLERRVDELEKRVVNAERLVHREREMRVEIQAVLSRRARRRLDRIRRSGGARLPMRGAQ